MATPLLYHFNGATCAIKVLLAFYEKDAAFDEVMLSREDLNTPEYRRLNPEGIVPTLVHAGASITESSVIMTYVDDVFDGRPLMPTDPLACARARWLMKRVDDTFDALRTLSFAMYLREKMVALPKAVLHAELAHIPFEAVRSQRARLIDKGIAAIDVLPAMQRIVALQASAEASLANGSDFLTGPYSLADAALTPFISRFSNLGLMLPETITPNLHRWWRGIRERESFDKALSARIPASSTEMASEAADKYRVDIASLLAHPECRRAIGMYLS